MRLEVLLAGCVTLWSFSVAWPSADAADEAAAASAAGVKVELADPAGSATVSLTALGKHRLRIDVHPRGQREPLVLRIELASSGSGYWPAEDVEVLDADGRPVPRRHNGTEWHKFTMRVPPQQANYRVRVVRPSGPRPRVVPEKERQVMDPATGLSARIANWYDGRQATLCMRFDDSHPTHLSTAIPALREYGFRATFMINPGARDARSPPRWRSAYQAHRAEWEAVARQGDQEFANHTLHHRGAADDEEMDREIGEAAKILWSLFPDRSKLLALNLGGGTGWETTKTLRSYLDTYSSFIVTGSLGMDDTYGNRVAAFGQHLDRNLSPDRLGWCKVHFHSVGTGAASGEENFRAVLEIVKEHASDLWITGLAHAYKYLTERRGAKLSIKNAGPTRVRLTILCSTDVRFYDHPLTIDLALPKSWANRRVVVTDSKAKPVEARQVP
ncbi:MAG: polysaccharide deacetylase family protein, partial [Pirellulales bacterium]